jgi:hypothetical protein
MTKQLQTRPEHLARAETVTKIKNLLRQSHATSSTSTNLIQVKTLRKPRPYLNAFTDILRAHLYIRTSEQ